MSNINETIKKMNTANVLLDAFGGDFTTTHNQKQEKN